MKIKGVIMKIIKFFIMVLLIARSITSIAENRNNKGIIKGTVIELESGEKLSGANITVKNTLLGAFSNSNGEYQILDLGTGIYELECSLLGYKSIIISDVQVNGGKPREITFILSPTNLENDIITVNFQMPKKIPHTNGCSVDPDFTILVDPSIDPNIIIAVDPSVDPGIFMNSIKSSVVTKSIHDTQKIRILDSVNKKPESERKKVK